jgi:hypothetical protein
VTVFTGPTQTGVALTGATPAAKALFRHYRPVVTGRNVFILTDGTVTETQPWPYETVARVLMGGLAEPVTDAEATLLTAAGYAAYLT